MIQKPIRTLLLAVSLCATAPLAHAQLKVGTIDMNGVFTAYYKTKDAEAKLNDERTSAKKEYDDRVTTLKNNMDIINKLNIELEKPELSKDAKEVKTKERDDKVTETRSLDKEATDFKITKEKALQEQFMRMRGEIIGDIMKVVNDKVKTAGYDIVFDKSGLSMGQIPVVVYSSESYDFSKEVAAKLNADAPKKPSAANN
ncbi:MAG: OmpH family outer membrane protein [Chthoniobacterales bacterium]